MKTKIAIWSIFAVCILMMLPSVSAVEFNTATESNKSQIFEQMQNIDVNEFKETLKTSDFPRIMRILTFLSDLIYNLGIFLNILIVGPFLILLGLYFWITGTTIDPHDYKY